MGSKKHFWINVLLAVIVSSIIVGFSGRDFLKRFELAGLDILFRVRGPQPYEKNICIIEIQDEDILKVGRWPWARTWHATLIRALSKMDAKEIYFDMLFSEASNNETDDSMMAAAMKEADNVYLPFAYFQSRDQDYQILRPINLLYQYTKGAGAINIYPDIDGSLRRMPVAFKI